MMMLAVMTTISVRSCCNALITEFQGQKYTIVISLKDEMKDGWMQIT